MLNFQQVEFSMGEYSVERFENNIEIILERYPDTFDRLPFTPNILQLAQICSIVCEIFGARSWQDISEYLEGQNVVFELMQDGFSLSEIQNVSTFCEAVLDLQKKTPQYCSKS